MYYRRAHRRQDGAVLLVGLVILLVMTLVGVAGMEGSIMEQKMARNMRDGDVAFQSAEEALAYCEQWLNESPQQRIVGSVDGGTVASLQIDYRSGKVVKGASSNSASVEPTDWWQSIDWSDDALTYEVDTKRDYQAGVGRCVITALLNARERDHLGTPQYGQFQSVSYRVTARGMGTRDTTSVIVESTYTRPE